MKKSKFLILSIVCLALILVTLPFISACSTGQAPSPAPAKPAAPPQPPSAPIKIGALLPLTGSFAMWGETFKNNIQYALDESGKKVAGRPVELLIEDEGGQDVTMALAKAKKLVESDKVGVLMGPFYTGSCLAVFPYASKVPIVTMKYASVAQDEIAPDYIFSAGVRYNDATYYLGQYAYDVMGLRTVTTIGSDFAAGQIFMKGFVDAFTAKGGKVIQQQWAPLTETDYSPYLSNLKTADALISSCLGPQAKLVLFKQYEELGLFKKMPIVLAEAGPIPDPVMQQMGDKIIGMVGPNLYLTFLDNPTNKSFLQAYKAKFKQDPDNMAVTAYASMVSVLKGLEATNGDTTPGKLKAALVNVKMDMPQGKFAFSPRRVAAQDLFITKIEKVDGVLKWTLAKTYPQIQPYD